MMSAAHDISPNVLKYMYVKYLLDLIHGVWGCKTEFKVLNSHFSLEFFTYYTYCLLYTSPSPRDA